MHSQMPRPKAYSYIRMSTDVQLDGDSLRRQLEASQKYADDHGLDLVEDYEDIGVSAFKGDNVKEGALGRFLSAVVNEQIVPGSYLLVESLDRISRQKLLEAHSVFLEIIKSGINLVTLIDGHLYRANSIDLKDFIVSLVSLARANEESEHKSYRVAQSWERKRKNAADQKLTAICPAWLKATWNRSGKDRRNFLVIDERAALVRSIFDDCATGMGIDAITRRLNKRKIPTFQKSNGWHNSYVARILSNRAVLGEFQPHKRDDYGRRVPDGEPIKGYFPTIVDDQLFYRARDARIERDVRGRGRKGQFVSNIFSGIASCAYCSAPMRFENKGDGPKGGKFLVCEAAKRGMNCGATRWRYDHFEASFLAFVRDLDLESMVRSDEEVRKRTEIDNNIAALNGERAEVETQRDRTYQLFLMKGEAIDFLSEKLNGLHLRLTELDEAIRKKEDERNLLNSEASQFYESKEQIKALIDRLQKPSGDEIYRLRSQIASRLRSLVSKVRVGPVGETPLIVRALEGLARDESEMITPDGPTVTDLIRHYESLLGTDVAEKRYFEVEFKSGMTQRINPSDDDPLRVESQVVQAGGTVSIIDSGGVETAIEFQPVIGDQDHSSKIDTANLD